jgi:hypothetical protein
MTDKIYQSPRDLYLQRHGCDDLYEEKEVRQQPPRFRLVFSLLMLVIGFGIGYGFYWFRLQGLM